MSGIEVKKRMERHDIIIFLIAMIDELEQCMKYILKQFHATQSIL